jgi:pilus assembly protein CpaB
MNTKRLVVLGFALVAASAAALLARGMIGGGTPAVEAKPAPVIAMSEVLVASANLQPGQKLTAEQVRWDKWPSSAVDAAFITRGGGGSTEDVVKGTVVRSPILTGQPITNTAIVHADAAGFMAAMLSPGMRAVSITITTDSGAGGFILPNDRIDLILTQKYGDSPPRARARTILTNVRVLAVDQTSAQEKDTKSVVAKSATLELTPSQAEQVTRAQNQGQLSLALRPLGDSDDAVASNAAANMPAAGNTNASDSNLGDGEAAGSTVAIIRYGIGHPKDANAEKDTGR